MNWWRQTLRAMAFVAALWSLPVVAQAKVAMPILLKVLTYDETFDSRGTGPFTVAVTCEPGQEGVRDALVEELKSLTVTSIKNRPLKFVAVEFKDEKSLSADLTRTGADAILATPGLSPAGVKAVSAAAEKAKRYSLAFDAAMVEQALSVGVTTEGGRPQIVINDRASKAVGAKFDVAVLKLARIVK
jgi:hypothetical protein